MEDLNKNDILKTWFESNALEESTQKLYIKVIKSYCEFLNKSIDEIYYSALAEEKENVFLPERQYRRDILRYRNYLKERGNSPNTIKIHISALQSFFDAHYIRTPKIKVKKGDVSLEQNFGYLLSREEIKKMIDSCGSRDRAIIYMMALTGMSQKEVREFRLKKFVDIISRELKRQIRTMEDLFDCEKELEDVVLTIEMRREKRKYRYVTFLAPEATIAILNYLKERCYGRNDKIRIKNTFEGFLFVSTQGSPLNDVTLSRIYSSAGKRVGFDESHEKGSYRPWRSHGMRRFFISTIINVTHKHEEANFMAGHKVSNQDGSYWRVDFKELKKVYLDALPYLSLENVETKTIESDEFKILKEDSENRSKDIVYLKKEVNSLKKLLSDDEVIDDLNKI